MYLRYYPKSHRYYALVRGKKFSVPSVTTALQSIDKPALVPWAIGQAIDFIRPAIAPGVEHAESYLEEVYAQARKESGRVRRTAADVGTQVHAILERYPIDFSLLEPGPVRNGVTAGNDWLSAHNIEWVVKESPIYSRRYRYSGRLDGIARVDGILSLVDWKTSKGFYAEYRLQTAAYCRAYEEEHPSERIEQRILIRLGKEDGVFDPHIYPRASLRQDFNAFLAALRLHNRLKAIKQEEKLSRKREQEDLIS